MKYESVLVISPHTDDGELGAGGTIARFAEEDVEIHYVAFSSCEKSVPEGLPLDIVKEECLQATKTLGISFDHVSLLNFEVRTFPEHRQEMLEILITFKQKIKPKLVVIPSSSDMHQDHQTIYQEAIRAFKKESSIWGYEHPWNNLMFHPDIYVKLSEQQMAKKLAALKKYQSQANKSYFSDEYLRSLLISRGTQVDWQYAETFELIRLLV